MSAAELHLKTAKRTRAATRDHFFTRLAVVKQDIAARGVGGRIMDRVNEGARDTFSDAVELAEKNKGVLAGTLAAVVLWFLRNPIIAWVEQLVTGEQQSNEEEDDEQG